MLCYNVLDTPAEKVFDELTGLAADLCKTPVATITLIDEDREWYKAKVGIDDQQAPRDISFCAHTILQNDLLIIPDTFKDDRFSDNPFVLEDPPLRFYAGAPLITPEGHAIGTLCVIDHVPRRLNTFQKNALKILANCVITQLESRRMTHEIFEHGKALLGSHDELERRVQERTVELTKINRQLQQEIRERQSAEHALRESKTQLQNILDSLFTFVGLISIDGILLETNRAPLERASLTRENVIGKPFADTYWWSYSVGVQTRLRKALQNTAKGKVVRYDELVRLGENEFITIDVTFGPLYDSSGNIILIIASAVDITDRKLAEQTLYDLAEGFSVTSGGEFFRLLTKHIGDTLDMDYVVVNELVKGSDNIVRSVEVYYHGEYLEPLQYSLEGTPCQLVIGKGITSYESGVQKAFPEFSLFSNLGIEGYVGAPLFDSHNKPLGLVAVLNQRPINNIRQIESLVQIFATRAAAELERKQTEETLQYTQFTFDHLDDATFWVAENARIINVNDAACKSLGYSREELLSMSIPDIDPDFPAGKWVDYWKSTRHLTSATFETRHSRKDGTIFPVEIRSSHLVYRGREYRCTFARDITERNRADAALNRTHRALSVVSECNHAMLHAAEEQQLLDNICRIIVETGNYRMAWVGYAEQDERKSVRPVAYWGYDHGYIDTLNITWADTDRGHGQTGIAIRTGRSYITRNVRTDPNFAPWRLAAIAHGYESSVGIPLKKDGKVFGALMIYAQEADAFNPEEMQLLENLAENLAYGIFAIRTSQEHMEMEKALQLREEYLRFLYEENPTMYFTVAPDGMVLSVNEFGASELGYTVDELTGKSVLTVFPEFEREKVRLHMQECLGDFGRMHEWEIRKIRKDGELLWVKEVARAVTMPGGATAVLIVCRDITENKQVEERIKQNDLRLRNAQRIANLGFWEWDIVKDQVYWSDEVYRIFGIQRGSYNPAYEDFLQAVHPEDRKFVGDSVDKAINEGAEYNINHRVVLPDGEIRYVKEQGEVSYDETGKPVRMVGTVNDITQHKMAEDEIRMSQVRLRNLATRLQAIREEERARIAREIHDELGQTLTGLKMDLVWMREHLPRKQQNLAGRVDSMISLVDRKLDDTRRLAFRLRPALLDDLGLEAAIECELQEFADRASCEYSLDLRNGTLGQDRDRDTAVFRILQEALTNVGRHAKATQIDVALYSSNSELILTVRDNGVGIDYNKMESSESLGLIGMQERAGALGGNIFIMKTSEGGTEVTLKMPIT